MLNLLSCIVWPKCSPGIIGSKHSYMYIYEILCNASTHTQMFVPLFAIVLKCNYSVHIRTLILCLVETLFGRYTESALFWVRFLSEWTNVNEEREQKQAREGERARDGWSKEEIIQKPFERRMGTLSNGHDLWNGHTQTHTKWIGARIICDEEKKMTDTNERKKCVWKQKEWKEKRNDGRPSGWASKQNSDLDMQWIKGNTKPIHFIVGRAEKRARTRERATPMDGEKTIEREKKIRIDRWKWNSEWTNNETKGWNNVTHKSICLRMCVCVSVYFDVTHTSMYWTRFNAMKAICICQTPVCARLFNKRARALSERMDINLQVGKMHALCESISMRMSKYTKQ